MSVLHSRSSNTTALFPKATALGLLAATLGVAAMTGCSSAPEPITDCRDAKGIHPICGFQNPEDMSLLADGRRLIVSQYGSMTEIEMPGSLAILDLETEEHRVVYPPPAGSPTPVATPGWGVDQCPGPSLEPFNPHGIDLSVRADGRLQLLVVNHGGAESIEFFEVLPEPDNVQIVWRGCVVPPFHAFLNDVVSLPNGGFLATHMMEYGNAMWGMVRSMMGANTGFVYEWHPENGFSMVPGTKSPFPNGIEVSEDGSEVYLNVYAGNEVWRISRATGELLAKASVASPDNLTWAQDGRLLVASHTGGLSEQRPCMALESGACPMSFDIQALDPITMEGGPIFSNGGAPMGGGTVAIDVGGELVIGSFAGDRVIRVPLTEP
jgi:hypothetical protein